MDLHCVDAHGSGPQVSATNFMEDTMQLTRRRFFNLRLLLGRRTSTRTWLLQRVRCSTAVPDLSLSALERTMCVAHQPFA